MILVPNVEPLREFNPYHDPKTGRFSSKTGLPAYMTKDIRRAGLSKRQILRQGKWAMGSGYLHVPRDLTDESRATALSSLRHEIGHSWHPRADSLVKRRALGRADERRVKRLFNGDRHYAGEFEAWRNAYATGGHISPSALRRMLGSYADQSGAQDIGRDVALLRRYGRMVRRELRR